MAKKPTPGEELRARIMTEYEHHGSEPDAREVETIARAGAIADTIAILETVLETDGPTTIGPSGQTLLHPAIAELRAQRSALHRFLGSLRFEVEDGASISASARHAANRRWLKAAR